MDIQWPLLIFSVLLGVTSGCFVFLGVGELKGKFKDVRFLGALIAFVCLAVGAVVLRVIMYGVGTSVEQFIYH